MLDQSCDVDEYSLGRDHAILISYIECALLTNNIIKRGYVPNEDFIRLNIGYYIFVLPIFYFFFISPA